MGINQPNSVKPEMRGRKLRNVNRQRGVKVHTKKGVKQGLGVYIFLWSVCYVRRPSLFL